VTKAKAERVLAAVKKKYAAYLDGADESSQPFLATEFYVGRAPYAVVWEMGPSDWALVATSGDPTEEDWALLAEVGLKPSGSKPLAIPAGVYAEPLTSYALGLYPA
jgi:hypothetical protein